MVQSFMYNTVKIITNNWEKNDMLDMDPKNATFKFCRSL